MQNNHEFDNRNILTPVSLSIIHTLIYFDIFRYPLTEKEILKYLSVKHEGPIINELEGLLKKDLISKTEDFYFLGTDQDKVSRRIQGNTEATRYLSIAAKHTRLLSLLPFLQCICISGSLSKNYMDEKSDIDYFIITNKDRLWIVRLIFTFIIKSMWVFNSKKYFCPNYLIAENNLEIKDKNIYTAIEVATLISMYNHTTYSSFLMNNEWIKDYLPNFKKDDDTVAPDKKHRLYKLWEHSFFTYIDNVIYKIYKSYYERKFYHSEKWKLKEHELNFNKAVFKIHTVGHRHKILDQYEENIILYEKAHGINLR